MPAARASVTRRKMIARPDISSGRSGRTSFTTNAAIVGSAMKSPVRFMARGLADEVRYEKASLPLLYDGGGECDGSGGKGGSGRGGSRHAPALRPAIIQ